MPAIFQQKNAGWQDRILQQARQASRLVAAVGFPRGKGLGQAHYENGMSILQVAINNNFGFGVPRRPFMYVAAKNIKQKMRNLLAKTIKRINSGETDGKKELESFAILSQGIIQTTITDGNWKPNSPATIAAKGSDKPLIDSGDMRKAVTYVVRNK